MSNLLNEQIDILSEFITKKLIEINDQLNDRSMYIHKFKSNCVYN